MSARLKIEKNLKFSLEIDLFICFRVSLLLLVDIRDVVLF